MEKTLIKIYPSDRSFILPYCKFYNNFWLYALKMEHFINLHHKSFWNEFCFTQNYNVKVWLNIIPKRIWKCNSNWCRWDHLWNQYIYVVILYKIWGEKIFTKKNTTWLLSTYGLSIAKHWKKWNCKGDKFVIFFF